MYEEKVVIGIYTLTPLHAGSGSEISVIDLPIQRERHTGFPIVWGQSLKGALRSAFREYELSQKTENGKTLEQELKEKIKKIEEELKMADLSKNKKDDLKRKKKELEMALKSPPKTTVIFGPPTDNASAHAGAIAVGDAKVLLFPVRSARGVFAYVTCPLVLKRFKQDMELVGKNFEGVEIPEPSNNNAFVPTESALLISNEKIVLEEVSLTVNKIDLSGLASAISQVIPIGEDKLLKRLAIVPDDVFSAFVKLSTEVVARIVINSGTGTTENLWYEEFLPRDTVMYSVIAIGKPRKEGADNIDIKQTLNNVFNNSFIQLGGDETVGKGFVKIKISDVEKSEKG